MLKLLVTGGAGFMGSNFIRFMLKKHSDCRIINLDKLTYAGNLANLEDVAKNPRYSLIRGDINDPIIIQRVFRKTDIVINYAAETSVDRSLICADSFIKTNIGGVYNLLENLKGSPVKKIIQVSTDEVYGSLITGSAKEANRLLPNNPYASSKASADLLILSYYQTYKLPVIISRSCNNYGPYQNKEKFIPLSITNLIQNKPIPLYGRGENIREWLNVSDHCRAIELIIKRGKIGEVYNIGSGYRFSNKQVAKLMIKHLSRGEKMIKYVQDRPGHDLRYALNCAKIKSLGFKIKIPFRRGLKETIKWYQENRSPNF